MARLSISKAWDDARPIIARDGRLMFIIALATVVLPQAIMMLVAPEQGEAAAVAADEGWKSLLGIVFSLVNIVGSIAISYLALTKGASVGDGLRRGLQRLLPTIGTFLVAVIAVMAVAFVVIVMIAGVSLAALDNPEALTAEQISPAAALAIIGLFFFILWVSVRFLLVTPVIAAEDSGPLHILKRSWSLTKGHFWRILGFIILFVLGLLVIMGAASLIFGLAMTLMFGEPEPMSVSALFLGLGSGLAGALITVVYSTIVARIYLQLAGRPADPDAAELHASVPPTAE